MIFAITRPFWNVEGKCNGTPLVWTWISVVDETAISQLLFFKWYLIFKMCSTILIKYLAFLSRCHLTWICLCCLQHIFFEYLNLCFSTILYIERKCNSVQWNETNEHNVNSTLYLSYNSDLVNVHCQHNVIKSNKLASPAIFASIKRLSGAQCHSM